MNIKNIKKRPTELKYLKTSLKKRTLQKKLEDEVKRLGILFTLRTF